jgi:hypothetical protein
MDSHFNPSLIFFVKARSLSFKWDPVSCSTRVGFIKIPLFQKSYFTFFEEQQTDRPTD